jgi:hypothetical protein
MTYFHSTHAFKVKKGDNGVSLATGGIIKRRARPNSLCRDKNEQ